jgi:hypothetical protein
MSRLAACALLILSSVAMVACSNGAGTELLGAGVTPAPTPQPRARSLAELNIGLQSPSPLDCTPTVPPAKKPMSNLTFSGPCIFTERAAMSCVRKVDDFFVYLRYKLPENGTLVVTINVEHYKAPGRYDHRTQIDLEVSRGTYIYPWEITTASSTVAPDARHVHVDAVAVPPQVGTSALGVEHVSGEAYCAT